MKNRNGSNDVTIFIKIFLHADLDDDTIDAQCLLFLIAGYETSSTLLSFAIHVLATKPELQTKLREHIMEITDGKKIDYDVLAQLNYLDGFLLGKYALLTQVLCKLL